MEQLANAILNRASLGPEKALAAAIKDTADQHRETCDLVHPGTPAAAVAIAHAEAGELRYLVLCDATLVLETAAGITVVTDSRMGQTAPDERATANESPIDSPEKAQALVRMKQAELEARNVPGGYWVASSDPSVVDHAITGAVPLAELRRAAVLTDGAARLVDAFGLLSWTELLDLFSTAGPDELLRRTRAVEERDPSGIRWPRNKTSDDATAAYLVPSY